MSAQAHALMQYARDADAVGAQAVDDDVGADKVSEVRRRQVVPAMTDLWVTADRLERVINLVPVGLKLIGSPGLPGVPQDVDEILPCFRG